MSPSFVPWRMRKKKHIPFLKVPLQATACLLGSKLNGAYFWVRGYAVDCTLSLPFPSGCQLIWRFFPFLTKLVGINKSYASDYELFCNMNSLVLNTHILQMCTSRFRVPNMSRLNKYSHGCMDSYVSVYICVYICAEYTESHSYYIVNTHFNPPQPTFNVRSALVCNSSVR